MKMIKRLLVFMLVPMQLCAGELYQKLGVFDYKHDTDAYALTTKYVDDDKVNIKFFGNLNPIYELSLYYDDENPKKQGYGTYLSTGLMKKIDLSKNFFLAPSFSVGLYQDFDEGKDMGYPLEFKSEIEINYNLFKNSVIGISWNHISNADIGDKNPGSDNLLFNLRFRENF
jgi:lipid A 3-O-deacylase